MFVHIYSVCVSQTFQIFQWLPIPCLSEYKEYNSVFSPPAFYFYTVSCCSSISLNINQLQTYGSMRSGFSQWWVLTVSAAGCSEYTFRKPGSLCIVYILSAVLQCPVARVGRGGVEGGSSFSSSGGWWLWSLRQPNPQTSCCWKDRNKPFPTSAPTESYHTPF